MILVDLKRPRIVVFQKNEEDAPYDSDEEIDAHGPDDDIFCNGSFHALKLIYVKVRYVEHLHTIRPT